MDENEVNVQREDALRDALIERLRAAGIDVVTDYKEGERVLQQENSKAGFIPDLSHVDGDTLDYSLMEDVNAQRSRDNQHFISDRNQLTMEEKETQQKAWRDVFKSLSEDYSSDPRRRAKAPVITYSSSKPNDGANIGKISRIYDQLNDLLREINNKDLSREQFTNILAGSLGLRFDKDKVSRYSEEPITLRNGEKVSLRISNHPAFAVNFIRWNNNLNLSYGLVFRGEGKGQFHADKNVDHLEIDYYRDSIDQATVSARRDLYRDIVNGIKFMLEEGSLEMMPFPDHLNASGVFKKPLEEFRKEHPEMLFHQEIEDAPSELATILSGGISREEVEEAFNSKLVQRWIKANNSNEESTKKGFDLFGIGPSLIHEFARGRLGINNRYDPGSNVFFNSWEWLGEYLRAAKEDGLSPAIADKYDLRFGSDDVKHIQEHPDAIFTDAEMEEIEKHMKPKGFEDFKAVLRSFSEAEKVKAEEERIKGYEGGDALTKAFMLWKIALSRLKSEHYGDSRWFFKQRTWHAPDGSHGILTSNQKIRPGMTEGFTYYLKSDVAKRIMYMIATSPIAEKLPLLEARFHGMPSVSDPSEEVRFMLAPDSQSPIFISNAWLALHKIKQDKATPEQWLKMLEKLGGIKAGEDRWTGLSQWLKDSQENSLSKMDIAKYLHDNMINVEEVHYIEARSLEDSEQFRAYQREFDDIKAHVNDLYEAADNKYDEFIAEMTEKYGEDWTDQLTDEEDRQERYLLKVREDCDTSYHTPTEIAYDEMISRYGDDWGMAFSYYQEDGQLTIEDEDRAVYFLGEVVSVDRAINGTRLRFTTDELNNKREIALTVPTIESWNSNDEIHFGDADDGRAIAWVRFGDTITKRPLTDAEVAAELQKLPTADQWEKVDGSNFVTKRDVYFAPGTRNDVGHNYIVDRDGRFVVELSTQYLRHHISSPFNKEGYATLAEAVDAYNRWQVSRMTMDEKVLVIDEIQSKRHQDGREKGYRRSIRAERDAVAKIWSDSGRTDDNAYKRLQALNQELRNWEEHGQWKDNKVPAAPFEKNWQDLCMKRMLRYAAENGYDRVAWLNGEQQADRYDLGKLVDRVTVNAPDDNGKRKVAIQPVEDTSGHVDMMYLSVDKDGIVYSNSNPDWIERHISEVVGKPLADKIMSAEEFTVFEDNDLRVGIYGMKAFYDEMLPSFMNKYGKQWGVHVEDMDIPALQREDSSDGVALHGVKVTKQMKQDVLQGQPMFFRSGAHQAYGFVHNGTIYIDPRVATAETPIHEYTHLWAEVLRQRNPKEWDHIVTMMKDSPQLWQHVEQSYAARWKVQLEKGLLTQKEYDYRVADEVLAQFSGKRGYEKLSAFADGQPDGKGILDAMLEILKEFWSRVTEFFGVHFQDKEQVADRVLYDLLQGVNPLVYKREDIQGLHESQAENAARDDDGVPLVKPRTDIPEHDIRTAERAARTAVIERITDYGARSLSDEQRGVISHYRAMFTSDTSTGELYNRLLESVLDDPEVRSCPREWAQAAAEELQDMAVGKVHSEEENIGFKR